MEGRIEQLLYNPLPRGVAKLAGLKDAYRIRIGNYRVLYRVLWREKKVVVFRIAPRRKTYRGL